MKEATEDFAAAVRTGSRKKSSRYKALGAHLSSGDNAMTIAQAYLKQRLKHEAQHGIVRVIVKDGKPA